MRFLVALLLSQSVAIALASAATLTNAYGGQLIASGDLLTQYTNVGGDGGGSTLLNNLVGYWKLDETSGNRADSIGTNNFADNASVSYEAAKISNGAKFDRSADNYLSIADNADVSLGADTDFTICFWVKIPNFTTSYQGLICKRATSGSTTVEYEIYYGNASGTFSFFLSNGSTTSPTASVTVGSFSTSTLYFVCAWHDSAANTINLQINNGTVSSQSWSGGTQNGTAPLILSRLWATDAANDSNATLDELGFWKRVLTSDERTELYNSGTGKTYPFSP